MQPANNTAYEFPISGNVRPKEAARFLGIGVSTLYLYIKQKRITPPVKHGERISVFDAQYIRELAKNGIGLLK